jgi:dipeptidyl aminopeptidase/acylaminoacyl peptidase
MQSQLRADGEDNGIDTMSLRSKTLDVALRHGTCFALTAIVLLSFGCRAPETVSRESTDLFLVQMWSDDGLAQLSDPTNLTNRGGYDNQPSYAPDGRSVLYVSREGLKSDIYRYDLDTEEISRLTSAGDREYSPKMLPDASGFSTIRAEREGRRRLWAYETDGENAEPLWIHISDPMLYYAWVDSTTAAVVIENPSGLRVLNTVEVESDVPTPRVENVGRSVNRIPGRRAVSFVHKTTVADWWISEIDLDTGEVRKIARTIQGSEDHAWTPSGAILMGRGSDLYKFVPGGDDTWRPIANFSRHGVRRISRLAVSPEGDSMVLVAESVSE